MEEELITLGILFFFALIGGILAARFKQPMLMGLLLVGALIGPKAFGLIHNEKVMESMIEFGAILILFVIGLEFDLTKLKKVGSKAMLIAILNSAILTFVGFMISLTLGFSVQASLFMGVILAFGSTVVIVKVLENKGLMDRQEVPLLIAILIIEDIIAVLVITFFSGVKDQSQGLMGSIETLVISMCILMISYIVFVRFIKPILEWIIRGNNSEEITTFMALAMCAGFSYFAYHLHLSPAVGAFLAGSIVASLPNSKEFVKSIEPYNLIISAFFFLAIGTLIDFNAIVENIMIILILVFAVIIIKLTAFSSMVYFFANMKGEKMFFSSIAMFSIGEFSLLVAKESTKFNIGIDLISISAAMIAISAVIMSLTIGYSNKLYEPTMDKMPWKFKKNLEKFSGYIKSVSDELDMENKNNKAVNRYMSNTALALMGSLLIFFGIRKLTKMMHIENASMILVISLVCSVLMLIYAIYNANKLSKALGDVIGSATNTRNSKQNRKIVYRAFGALGGIIIGTLFPFVMFLFNLHGAYVIVSIVLIGTALWNIRKIMKTTGSENPGDVFVSHHFDTSRQKNGWRI